MVSLLSSRVLLPSTRECIEFVILITMKAMNDVTVVMKITDRGGQPLWSMSHWMFTRTTPGQELKTAKEPDSTSADWRTVMGRLRISSIDGVADLRWRLRRWGTGTGWSMRLRPAAERLSWATPGWLY